MHTHGYESEHKQPNKQLQNKSILVEESADLGYSFSSGTYWTCLLRQVHVISEDRFLSYKATAIAPTLSWSWDQRKCISYRSLWNKLLQNLAPLSNRHLLSPYFLLVGIQVYLCWVVSQTGADSPPHPGPGPLSLPPPHPWTLVIGTRPEILPFCSQGPQSFQPYQDQTKENPPAQVGTKRLADAPRPKRGLKVTQGSLCCTCNKLALWFSPPTPNGFHFGACG